MDLKEEFQPLNEIMKFLGKWTELGKEIIMIEVSKTHKQRYVLPNILTTKSMITKLQICITIQDK